MFLLKNSKNILTLSWQKLRLFAIETYEKVREF
jgi:hypothetical protein